ncbi:hypothetical protein [Nocardioides litoris]|uniref:hypothetical protein n=1 Tax=Nocardioides litoris TaxID=1926648 RepID=UPI00111DC6E0|nr:hypothetical protein [Nocardioides litoris]
MDAAGIDPPVAVVAGRRTPLTDAVVHLLLDRGYDVHLPAGLVPDEVGAHDRRHLRPLHVLAGPEPADPFEPLVAAAIAGGRPLGLVVLVDGTAAAQRAATAVVRGRAGGRVLALRSPAGHRRWVRARTTPRSVDRTVRGALDAVAG